MDGEKILDISWGSIFKIFFAAAIFYFVYLTRDILILFIFALIISVLFNPAIDFLVKKRVPRILSVLGIYLFIFSIIGILIFLIAPIFIDDIVLFAERFPQFFDKFAPVFKGLGFEDRALENFDNFSQAIREWLLNASSSIFKAIVSIFGSIFSTVTIFLLSIFLSLEERGIEKIIILLFPKRYESNMLNLWARCQNKVASWFGMRILTSLFVGFMTFIVCKILKIEYAISFGLLAGVTNIIPVIGPVVAGALITIFVMLDSLSKAIFVLIIYILIQQIEGNIITPLLSKKFIGLSPALVLIALMVGGKLWGIMGAILAIPLFGILFEFIKEFLKKKRDEKAVVL
ncbi:MAG: AI-2E family transporter [Candidatus Nealsonbacteria bacterium]